MTFRHPVAILPADIDHMGHVNNAVYLKWVQDAVVDYWSSVAPPSAVAAHLWVALKHEITYRRPAFLSDDVVASTVLEKVAGARAFYNTVIEATSGGQNSNLYTLGIRQEFGGIHIRYNGHDSHGYHYTITGGSTSHIPGERLAVGAGAVGVEEPLHLLPVGGGEEPDLLLPGHRRRLGACPHPVPLAAAAAEVEPLRDHRHQAARHAEVPVPIAGDPGAHGRVVGAAELGRQVHGRPFGERHRADGCGAHTHLG